MKAVAGIVLAALVASASAFAAPRPSSQQQPPPQPAQKPAVSAPAPAADESMTPAQREEIRGDIFMARKMYPEAVKTYQDLLLADQRNAKILNKVGIAYHQMGDLRMAERYYKRSAQADKNFGSPLNNLGTIEFGKHKYKGAIKDYKRALKVDPEMAAAYCNLGYAYLERKDANDAIVAFRQAVVVDPTIFEDRGSAGSVVEQRGMTDPGQFYYTLAKTYAIMGNAERCAHYLTMSRDEGYKKYTEALKDPAFKSVLKDPRVQIILAPAAPGATAGR
ncbi:MAG TPA: tetratricopeptide repeat protein [Candidatus Acidoferrales bacterium]|nr:tetratricopeptide repeat protein [Candidatus Acidoferrales bacterium]